MPRVPKSKGTERVPRGKGDHLMDRLHTRSARGVFGSTVFTPEIEEEESRLVRNDRRFVPKDQLRKEDRLIGKPCTGATNCRRHISVENFEPQMHIPQRFVPLEEIADPNATAFEFFDEVDGHLLDELFDEFETPSASLPA